MESFKQSEYVLETLVLAKFVVLKCLEFTPLRQITYVLIEKMTKCTFKLNFMILDLQPLLEK